MRDISEKHLDFQRKIKYASYATDVLCVLALATVEGILKIADCNARDQIEPGPLVACVVVGMIGLASVIFQVLAVFFSKQVLYALTVKDISFSQ